MKGGIDLRMRACGKKILVVSGKGGVGKSSFATLLSNALTGKKNARGKDAKVSNTVVH